MLQLVNTSAELETDSDNCSENESNIEIAFHKERRLNVLSTSESEEIEDNNAQNTVSSNIIWTMTKFSPVTIYDFTVRNSGIQAGINYSWKIIDYFQLFVSEEYIEELIEYIVEKTNNHWQQKNSNNLIADTELSELYCINYIIFIAVSFLMTRNKKLVGSGSGLINVSLLDCNN